MKQVIFNVGGALCTYIEFYGKKLLVDLGKSQDFHPVEDFLLPLFQRRSDETHSDGRFKVDQLLISHPHNDHISGIKEFDKAFHADLLTCPNDNEGMQDEEMINWDNFEESTSIEVLRTMLEGRTPPLRATHDQNEFIYYLPPKEVEESELLNGESYCNNISIVVFLIIGSHRIFMPGDIQKEGMKELLANNHYLKNKLRGGVDILVAPHHGLRSSFSTAMYDVMKGRKTRSMHIISEKVNADDSRNVDTRYSTSDYCLGENNLSSSDSPSYQLKTSRGHIYIDYSRQRPINC